MEPRHVILMEERTGAENGALWITCGESVRVGYLPLLPRVRSQRDILKVRPDMQDLREPRAVPEMRSSATVYYSTSPVKEELCWFLKVSIQKVSLC